MKFLRAVQGLTALSAVDIVGQQQQQLSSIEYFEERLRKCDELVRRFKEEHGVPGVAVALAVDGKVLWRQGYGYSDVENLTPCTAETVMRIASISKPITMALAAKLVEQGVLDLDAPIQKYVPGFPDKTFDGDKVLITCRLLASHLSGIRHYEKSIAEKPEKLNLCVKCEHAVRNSEFEHGEYFLRDEFRSVSDALKVFKDDPLIHKPGTKFLYSTHAWTLLAAAVEGAAKGAAPSSTDFEGMLASMFSSIGMKSTALDRNQALISGRANFYKRDRKGRLVNSPTVNNSYKWAGGGLLSTVGDLALFGVEMARAYAGVPGCFLDGQTVRMMWTPVSNTGWPRSVSCPRYGMGWCVASWSGPLEQLASCTRRPSEDLVASHTGGAVGASSILLVKPLCNADGTKHDAGNAKSAEGHIVVAILTNLQECGGLYKLAIDLCKEFM